MNEVLMHVKRPNSVNTEYGEELKYGPPIHKQYFHSLFHSVAFNCRGDKRGGVNVARFTGYCHAIGQTHFQVTGTMLKTFKFISKI